MTQWIGLDPRYGPDVLGYLTDILMDSDPRPVREQLEDRYAHGGGWRPMRGFRLQKGQNILAKPTLLYPGDPPFRAVAMAKINKEWVLFYPQSSFLAVVAEDGTWEVTRVD